MSETYKFERAVMIRKIHAASDLRNWDEIDRLQGIYDQLGQTENEEALLREIEMLRRVGRAVVNHFEALNIPRSNLRLRTLNGGGPNSVNKLASGWILGQTEYPESGIEQTLFDGYLLNKSTDLYKFRGSELQIENGIETYVVSRYGDDFLFRDIRSTPYPDFDDSATGDVEKLDYHGLGNNYLIRELFVDTVIQHGIEIKI